MSLSIWKMSVGDALNQELNQMSKAQKTHFTPIVERYEEFVRENDSILTFGEYYNAYEK